MCIVFIPTEVKPVDLSYSSTHFLPSLITSSCGITEHWKDCIFGSKRI